MINVIVYKPGSSLWDIKHPGQTEAGPNPRARLGKEVEESTTISVLDNMSLKLSTIPSSLVQPSADYFLFAFLTTTSLRHTQIVG